MNSMDMPVDMMDTRAREEEPDSLLPLLAVLWTRKWRIVLAALLAGLLGLAYAMTRTPQYSAEALVQLETRGGGLQLSADIAEMFAPESEAVTEIEILRSRLVLGRVVESLGLETVATPVRLPLIGDYLARVAYPRPDLPLLDGYAWHAESIEVAQLDVPADWVGQTLVLTKAEGNRYTLDTPSGETLEGVVGEPLLADEADFTLVASALEGEIGSRFEVRRRSLPAAANHVRAGLTVSEKTRGTGIIRVAMTTSDPALSKAIVAGIVDAYVDQNINRSAEEAERSLTFLDEQLPLVLSQLQEAERELNEYRLQSESIDLDYEAQSILERSVTIDAQLSGLSLEETEISRRYTPNHPTYLALLEKKERLLEEKDSLASSVRNLPATQQEILRKMRDVDVSQQIYLQLLNKSQELNVMKAGAVGNVRLIEEAAAGAAPVSPRVPLIAALATLLGGVAAATLVLVRHNVAREIDNPDDLAHVGAPTLAVIPFSRFQSRASRRHEYALLAKDHSSELAVEALRSLRTSLHYDLLERGGKVVCVTGPSPGVGKSFVASNLAFLAAQSGADVLVVDGDMRRGNLARFYDVPQDLPGMAEMLDGSRAPSTVMYEVDTQTLTIRDSHSARARRAVVPSRGKRLAPDIECEYDDEIQAAATDVADSETTGSASLTHASNSSITVVPRGQSPSNPSELLMGERFSAFLERASARFDLVVVDTPPVLAATDAMIIGKHSDVRLMVVRQGETTTREAAEVVRVFGNNKSRINALVLNGFDPRRGKYGRYGLHYGYRYEYS